MRKLFRPEVPFHPAKWPFFYGWMILVWGTLGILMSAPGQTIGVSVFTDSLIDALQITRDQLSLAYMFGTIASSFMLPWVGKIYDKYGVRQVGIAAALGLCLVLFYLSQVDRLVRLIAPAPALLLTMSMVFLGFMLLRFCGQGILTMVSRNMMMKWFEQRRGFATGFSNVFVSLSFSLTPAVLDELIAAYDWRMAWMIIAAIAGLVFPAIIFVFFRDNPEEAGLKADGESYQMSARKQKYYFPVKRAFTKKEALKAYSFWIFASILAMQGLYITGFTFHVVSIFAEVGLPREAAVSIFQPIAAIAVVLTLAASYLSDFIPLKFILLLKGTGACMSTLGVLLLGSYPFAIYLLIGGTGIMSGLFSVLSSVTWPRFFGKTHLGAISSQALMFVVFGSALGPILFSSSLSQTGTYQTACLVCFLVFLLITLGGIKADNPQIKVEEETA